MWRWGGLLAVAGCSHLFGLDAPALVDADGETPVDASVCVVTETSCASVDLLRSCVAGEAAIETPCAWGCNNPSMANPVPHCAELVPGGGEVLPEHVLPDAMLADVMLDNVTINADTGQIGGPMNAVRDAGHGVISGIDFQVRGSVAVFRFESVTISGVVLAVGTRPIALVADGPVTISGVVDMRGSCGGTSAGPGGVDGGGRGMSAAGPGGGLRGVDEEEGGGGGGYGGLGGAGGNNGTNNGGTFGGPRIPNLTGGGGGGGGADVNRGGVGGGGGGALQIASNTHITIAATGGINAGGCGGKHGLGPGSGGGGGGGAGGAILLEAPVLTIAGALAVNGGGGGGATDLGSNGKPGELTRDPALGGNGAGTGGAGGAGASAAVTAGSNGSALNEGGGGGGGIGRMRFATRTGQVVIESQAVLSPGLTDNATTTAGVAVVQ
jgi:hypothetical protein